MKNSGDDLNPRVLIVQDNRAASDVLGNALRREGFDVCVVTDRPSALTEIARQAPDAIVLDLDLGIVSGLTFHEELLVHDRTRHIAVLIVTETTFSPYAVLAKPVSVSALISVINSGIRSERQFEMDEQAIPAPMPALGDTGP